MQNVDCFHTAFAGSIPQRVQVANLNPQWAIIAEKGPVRLVQLQRLVRHI